MRDGYNAEENEEDNEGDSDAENVADFKASANQIEDEDAQIESESLAEEEADRELNFGGSSFSNLHSSEFVTSVPPSWASKGRNAMHLAAGASTRPWPTNNRHGRGSKGALEEKI